jgi:hypothetical protein
LNDILAAHVVGSLVGVGGYLRVEDHLDDALAVPQVDKDQPAVVAAAVHPPRQRYLHAGIFFA